MRCDEGGIATMNENGRSDLARAAVGEATWRLLHPWHWGAEACVHDARRADHLLVEIQAIDPGGDSDFDLDLLARGRARRAAGHRLIAARRKELSLAEAELLA